MPKRIAVIDLGSNTCRLVIYELDAQQSFRLIDQIAGAVRIAEGMFTENRLQPAPMQRTVQLLRLFADLIRANGITRVIATATSAVRDAANGAEFLAWAEQETGLHLHILTGEQEAYYGYLGVVNSLALENGVTADLGGGSLELVRVENRRPVAYTSLPLGAVRLTAQFLGSDPIKERQAHRLADYIDAQLDQVKWLAALEGTAFVALGGTMRALAKIDQLVRGYPLENLHGYVLSRKTVHRLAEDLTRRRLKQRKQIPGLQPERADVIPAGAIVIFHLMKRLHCKNITLSGQGLRDGLFYQELLGAQTGASIVPEIAAAAPFPAEPPLVSNVQAFGLANIAIRYGIDWPHSLHVARLALSLFDQLAPLHGYGPRDRALLASTGVLHDVGVLIDYYRHHRHSAYILLNADLPGWTHREIALMALLVRYHRRGLPEIDPYRELLQPDDPVRIQRLTALLRLAEDLERSRTQMVRQVRCELGLEQVHIWAVTRGNAAAELWAANLKRDLFQLAFGRALQVTPTPAEPEPAPPPEPDSIFQRAETLAALLRMGAYAQDIETSALPG